MFSKISISFAGILFPFALFAQSDIIHFQGDQAESLFRGLSTVGAETKNSCVSQEPTEAVQVCVIEEARAQGDMSCSRFEDIRSTHTQSQTEEGHWYLTEKQTKITYLCKLLLH